MYFWGMVVGGAHVLTRKVVNVKISDVACVGRDLVSVLYRPDVEVFYCCVFITLKLHFSKMYINPHLFTLYVLIFR